jgi:phospholipase C
VFTYDEHGGYYDHVAPPAALNPGDGSHPMLKAG